METLEELLTPFASEAVPTPAAPPVQAAQAPAVPPPAQPDRFQETWEKAKETAREVKRTATKSWEDVSQDFDRGIKERPVTVALGALGTGLALGLLAGVALGLALKKGTR
jgi:hypothetical protein